MHIKGKTGQSGVDELDFLNEISMFYISQNIQKIFFITIKYMYYK